MSVVGKCSPYNGQLDGYKFARNKYYELQIEFFLNQHGHSISAKKAYEYFNIDDLPWNSLKMFQTHYYRIRKSLIETNQPSITLIPTLDSLIQSPSEADCATVVGEIKNVLERLSTRKDHESMMTKQTLMAAVCDLDDDGNVQNRIMLKHLMPKLDSRALQKCVSIKHNFNTTDTSLLHDPMSANKGGVRREFSEQIDNDIISYWLENTTPDPNTAKVRVIRDKKGNRVEKRYHYCHKKYSDMYDEWVSLYKSKYGDYERVPKLSYYMNLKPVWVYKAKSGDYSQCKKCYNFNSMTKALLRRLNKKGAHLITSVLCPNHDWYAMDCDECSCSECLSCADTIAALKKSPLKLIQYLCCNNHSKYPDLNCVDGSCYENQCGIFKIHQLLHSNLLRIPSNDDIGFKEIICISRTVNGKEKRCHSNVHQSMPWSEFIIYYIEYLKEFIGHYHSWIIQHQSRRDFIDFKFGTIKNDSIYCHFDFINNIKALWDDMSNGMWGDRESVSFMVSYDRFRDEKDKIIEESDSYFCDDPKHDWSAAIIFIRKHLIKRINEFKDKYHRNLEHIFAWSDNGEFKCSGFLCKISEIADELNVIIHWNFTKGGHSKGKHDGEGHVVKSEYRSAVLSGLINMNIQREPYSLTLKNYMTMHFNKKGVSKYTRSFHHVPAEEINHFTSKSVCQTLDGINSYHCFLIFHSKEVLCRVHSCHCDWCVTGSGWQRCLSSSVCGNWIRKRWKKVGVKSSSTVSPQSPSSICPVGYGAVSSMVQQTAWNGYGGGVHSFAPPQYYQIPPINGHIQQQQCPPSLTRYDAVHDQSVYCNNNRYTARNPY